MPRFVIEREFPGAGQLSAAELKAVAEKSNGILRDLGPDIQWEHSYVVDDKIYCVYIAKNADIIRRHAECGGFPVNKVSPVRSVIDPTTGNA